MQMCRLQLACRLNQAHRRAGRHTPGLAGTQAHWMPLGRAPSRMRPLAAHRSRAHHAPQQMPPPVQQQQDSHNALEGLLARLRQATAEFWVKLEMGLYLKHARHQSGTDLASMLASLRQPDTIMKHNAVVAAATEVPAVRRS